MDPVVSNKPPRLEKDWDEYSSEELFALFPVPKDKIAAVRKLGKKAVSPPTPNTAG